MSILKKILEQQKAEFLDRTTERYIIRAATFDITGNDLIKVILGPRRAGKSFLAMHLIKETGSYGYINLDDEFLAGITDTHALMEAVNVVWDHPKNLLFDEIQNLPKWELFLNRLQRQGQNLLVTGSNAHLLSSELSTHLTGRHLPYVLFPFSFQEFTEIRKPSPSHSDHSAHSVPLERYLTEGGFPEPLIKAVDRKFYLSTLLDSIIYKDIVRRFRLRSHAGIAAAARFLLSNTGNEYSHKRIAEISGCSSTQTAEKYVGYLEQAFLVFSLRRFSWKVRDQVRTNRKIYCIDNGLIVSGGFSISPETGRLAENGAAIALYKKKLSGELELFFWKNNDNHEVDFVIKRNNAVSQLIQVCWDIAEAQTKEREIRALLSAGTELHCTDLLILTESVDATEDHSWFGKRGTIRFRRLREWLIEMA